MPMQLVQDGVLIQNSLNGDALRAHGCDTFVTINPTPLREALYAA